MSRKVLVVHGRTPINKFHHRLWLDLDTGEWTSDWRLHDNDEWTYQPTSWEPLVTVFLRLFRENNWTLV